MATIEKRHRKGGKIVYRVKIDIRGARCQSATFDRLTDARRWAQTTEGDIRDGRYFRTVEAKCHTLGEAIDKYSKEVLPQKAKGGANQTAQLTWWKQKLGDHTLADVTSAVISEHRNFLLQEPKAPKSKSPAPDAVPKLRSPATVIRYLAALSHVFTVCIKEWGWTEDNPVGRVKMPKQSRGRVRFLSETEREGLITACKEINTTLHLVVVLAISTGMRRGELMSLRWSQVDFERDAIVLLRTKNGDRRRVPLTGYAARLLREHGKVRKIDSALVFPGEVPDHPIELKRPWLAALSAAKVEDFRFHDLRHCTASYLAMNGATLAEIAAVLGHRTLDMVRRYTHIAESHTSKVVAAMNSKIFSSQEAA